MWLSATGEEVVDAVLDTRVLAEAGGSGETPGLALRNADAIQRGFIRSWIQP
jgi:hypothetical protein